MSRSRSVAAVRESAGIKLTLIRTRLRKRNFQTFQLKQLNQILTQAVEVLDGVAPQTPARDAYEGG